MLVPPIHRGALMPLVMIFYLCGALARDHAVFE
jgi:hypothetical protein